MILNKRLIDKAYGKINLYLDVTGKRQDGFHEVKSIMNSVSLYDEIEIELSDSDRDSLVCDLVGIPLDHRNLALKAVDAFRKETGKIFGANIKIKKMIPAAAGLAGGSSDAACVLRLLKRLSSQYISDDLMMKIAASIGADVPFCYVCGTMLAEGKGEILTEIQNCPKLHLAIAIKGEGISTPWAYGALDKKFDDFSNTGCGEKLQKLLCALKDTDVERIPENMFNIFESVVENERPEIKALKKIMLDNGAIRTMMSGSGPSVFGIFSSEEEAKSAVEILRSYGADAHYCTT